jgi:hypothetical protein
MDKETMNTIIAKYVVIGIVALACLGASTCAYTEHEDNRAKVEVETCKMEAAKADRDKAMFEAMAKNPPPAASR